jgi:parvulin-like peptidyl-prolyl isomerase
VRASHILIRTDEKSDETAKKAARTQAEQLLARLRKGEEFAKLAREYSQDAGSAARGGDLGLVPKGQTVPAFDTVAFALKPGELSSVVQTPFGFHILKVVEHRAARQVPLPEASDQIRRFLTEQQRQQKTAAMVQELRAKARIELLI